MIIFGFVIIVSLILSFIIDPWFLVAAGAALIILTIINYVFRENHIYDLSRIKALDKKKDIYQKIADIQLIDFKNYLGKIYPEMEKDIFKSISPQNMDCYASSYPEIKSNETITKLVSLINDKVFNIYGCDLEKADIQARIDARFEDSIAWVIPGLLRKYKVEEKK